jgi:hypothetical protein
MTVEIVLDLLEKHIMMMSSSILSSSDSNKHKLKNYCIIIQNRKNYWIAESDNTNSSGRHLSHDGKVGFSSHAEMNALKMLFSEKFRSSKFRRLRNIKLYSIRAKIDKYTKQFQIANAKPCLRCMLMLSKWKIPKVYYSTDDGNVISCDDTEISSDEEIHRNFVLSSGDRNGPDGSLFR